MNSRPGAGLIIILFVYSMVFMFFYRGLSQPESDRVWKIYHEYKLGKILSLSEKDNAILSSYLKKYPNFEKELVKSKNIGNIIDKESGKYKK